MTVQGAVVRRQAAWLAVFLALAAAALYWAKWAPYWQKLPAVAAHHTLGASLLAGAPEPSLGAGLAYSATYFRAIWPALVAGLVVAAGIEALVPRGWLLKILAAGGTVRRSLIGGVLAMPSLMCTCCAAPPAVALRRLGVPSSSALAFWVGNPALNPVVIAFAAFVLPWPLVVLRAVSGLVLVLVAVPLISRLADRGEAPAAAAGAFAKALEPEPASLPQAARRFASALGRLAVTLLPEYLLVVFALGALRGLLFSAGHLTGPAEVVAVGLFAIGGTLFAIPTAGEVPIVDGLLKAGIGAGPAAALLVTLPAVSLPSLLMVWRSFPRRVTLALAGAVVLVGALGGLVAPFLLG